MPLLGSILNRAIFSHLLVAVPPAVILGQMVVSINEANLRVETQNLNLALATQMRDSLGAQIRLSVALLGHAERILALSALSIEERQDLLRALVAEQTLKKIEIFRPDGVFDSAIRPRAEGESAAGAADPNPTNNLPKSVLDRSQTHGFGLRTTPGDVRTVTVVVPWTLNDQLIGYLTTPLELSRFDAHAAELASQHIEGGGRIDVIDLAMTPVASSVPPGFGSEKGTPFSGLVLEGDRGGLAALKAGISTPYVDQQGERQLASVVSAPDLGWLVATSRPEAIAFKSITKVRFRVLLMSVAAALGAGIVALLLARQISRPIQMLIRTARRTAKEGFRSTKPIRAYGELGQLAFAFNTAIEQLDRYRKELRQTTQMRLRLSRLMSTGSSQDALAATEEQQNEDRDKITVLYADLSIVRQAPDIKSEDLVAVLSTFFAAAQESVRRQGGTLDRYSGDTVIGIFTDSPDGALVAAQDLVEDAKAVAERWQESTPILLSASAAIATGPGTLRRTIGTDELSVSGSVIERAAYAQAEADPDTIVIDERTQNTLTTPPPTIESHRSSEDMWFRIDGAP